MYPYNKAIDGSKANTFTATVHGDVITKYQILIHENNTGVSVYTSDEISGTYYNGDTIIFVLPSSQLQNGKDLLWKIKLWDRNNNTLTSPPVFFKTRTTPVVQVNEISSPHNRANVDFSGTYYQHQNVPIQYYIWNIYDAEDNLIDTSGKIYNSKLTYNYDGLLSGNTYKYQLVVVNQDNVQIASSKFSFSVYYDTYNYNIGLTPKVEILNDLNAAKIYLVGDKYSRGISTGRYSFVKDTPFIGANSVKINNGTIYYNASYYILAKTKGDGLVSEKPTTQQIPRRRRFNFLFIFRISPGFFVGFIPRRYAMSSSGYSPDYDYNYDNDYDYGYYDDDWSIQRISEQEYMFLRRIGIPEMNVMM